MSDDHPPDGDATDAPGSSDEEPASGSTPRLRPETDLGDRLRAARGLLLCTDFDGTLTRIVDDPDAPEITDANRESLRRLAASPRVEVAVVSGRALDDLRDRVGLDGVTYAGNHGLELHRDGRTTVHPVARSHRNGVETVRDAVVERVGDVQGVVVEDKDLTVTVHYRNAPADRRDEIRDAVFEAVARHAPDRVRTSTGKAVVELRPAVPWDKGSVVRLLAEDVGASWLPVYVGDDTTDEDAFRALAGVGGVGVRVGDEPTAASHRLPDTAAVERLLSWLADETPELLDT